MLSPWWLSASCPSCGAAAGEWCHSGTGRLQPNHPHARRTEPGILERQARAAREAKAEAAQVELELQAEGA